MSIYTNNIYESYDLDFVSLEDRRKIKKCMEKLEFKQVKSRHFIHPNTFYLVVFPGSAVMIEDKLIKEFSEIKTKQGTLRLLTPTDCVKDRLAAFYDWNDRLGWNQAVMGASTLPIHIHTVKSWSIKEGMKTKFNEFLINIKQYKS